MHRSMSSHATVHELSCSVPWALMQPSMSSHAAFHELSCIVPWLLTQPSMSFHAAVHGGSWQPSLAQDAPSSSPRLSPGPAGPPSCCFRRKTLKSAEGAGCDACPEWRWLLVRRCQRCPTVLRSVASGQAQDRIGHSVALALHTSRLADSRQLGTAATSAGALCSERRLGLIQPLHFRSLRQLGVLGQCPASQTGHKQTHGHRFNHTARQK